MEHRSIQVNGRAVPLLAMDTAIVGSGCAGFNAADWLWRFGRRDIAILTEGVQMGTSRNTGSDKQTYYKLSLASDGEDSVAQMAQTLFAGGGVHGDIALCEAAGSARSFLKLANLGVPFPTNEYGEYVGYKTDHDPRQRATSAGPLTSRYMTERLEEAVREKGIPILDGLQVFSLLVQQGRVQGLLCLNDQQLDTPSLGLCIVRAEQVILATGGPAGVYAASVYPESQTGMSGMALEAGAQGINLQQWQYGLASVQFRWNVSGTYQQVLPRYISVDASGVEREFLPGYFANPLEALGRVFLKGYQWPFDLEKAAGSSLIDIIVHHEIFDLGRRVYLDYRTDPTGLQKGFDRLPAEARDYLARSQALLPTPIARLERMNPMAIELYRQHGIDLWREPLEISVCAQHQNGGLAVDCHWQTTLPGLYCAGEVAGTFGVRRPGGSALNSTQVGSLRAAEQIAYSTSPGGRVDEDFLAFAAGEAAVWLQRFCRALERGGGESPLASREESQHQMSLAAGHIRDPEGMRRLAEQTARELAAFWEQAGVASPRELPALLKNRDILITRQALLSAMLFSAEAFGSHGSCLVPMPGGIPVSPHLPAFAYRPPQGDFIGQVLLTERKGEGFSSHLAPVRPLPQPDNWFETVWREYRARTGIANL